MRRCFRIPQAPKMVETCCSFRRRERLCFGHEEGPMNVLERPAKEASGAPLTSPLGLLAELTHRCPLGCP